MNNKLKWICAIFIAFTNIIHSQDNAEKEFLDEYAVTAYRFENGVLDTPVYSTVIDAKKIESSTAQNVAELLRKNGNIMFRTTESASGLGELAMRGYGENSSQRILIIIDGQRMNRSDLGQINWLQLPIEYIDTIEVMRGSQSAMYGNNAVAGVIKITTKKGSKENMASLSAYGGSYKMYSFNGLLTGSEGDWSYSADAARFYEDGYRDNSMNWTNSYNMSVAKDFSESLNLSMSGNFSNCEYASPGALYSWEDFENNPTITNTPNDFSKRNSGIYNAVLKSENDFGEGEIGLSGMFRNMDFNMQSWYTNPYTVNDQWSICFAPKYKFNINDGSSVFVGFDGEYIKVAYSGFQDFNHSTNTGYADFDRQSYAPYLGGNIKFAEDFLLIVAGRYEYTDTNGDSSDFVGTSNYSEKLHNDGFAANIGIAYSLDENSSIYFRFDQIYRYPALDEIASYQGYQMYIPFNANLKPEKGQNYEIGYKYYDSNWTLNANLFLQYLDNEIAYVPVGWTGYNTNLDPTIRYGLDFEASYEVKYWGASISGSLLRSEFDAGSYDGNRVPLVPTFYGIASIYAKPLDWVRIGLNASFTDSMQMGSDYANEAMEIPSYALFGFSAEFKFTRYSTLFFALENILDKNYLSTAYASAYGGTFFYSLYPAVGRTFKIGIKLSF